MIRKRRRIQPIIPLASMADIVFVLIAFFMLASSFTQSSDVPLDRAASPDVEPAETAQVSLSLDSQGQLMFQGQKKSIESLESELEFALENRKQREVQVTIDKNLTKKQYYPVLQALGRAGATPVLTGELEE